MTVTCEEALTRDKLLNILGEKGGFMNRLIFLCGYDEFYYGLANMTARTIRDSGYDGDLVIFTISDKSSRYGTCVNLATHSQSALVKPGAWGAFHNRLCTAFGFPKYSQPFDYFIIKTLPGTIVERDRYDFILYMDSDILVHTDKSLDGIFAHRVPISDFNSRAALKDVKVLEKYFTNEERVIARELRGIGGGAFGIPRAHYSFFDLYRQYYQEYVSEVPHDQPVLSFVKVRHHIEHPFDQWSNRYYFRHYWGNKKKEMIDDYTRRYGRAATEEIFPTLS